MAVVAHGTLLEVLTAALGVTLVSIAEAVLLAAGTVLRQLEAMAGTRVVLVLVLVRTAAGKLGADPPGPVG